MVYTIGKVVEHAKLLCSEAKSRYFNELGKLACEDSLAEFWSRAWPFFHGEGVLSTTAPYSVGTVAVNKGATLVTGTGTTWVTTWPTKAMIRIDGSGNDRFLVATFTSPTTLTLDAAWPYDNVAAANYTLEFPCLELPNYLDIKGVMSSYGWYKGVSPMTYQELMIARMGWLLSSYPYWYCIVPGDGLNSTTKLWLSPSPNSVMTIRYSYKANVPAFLMWDYGSVTVNNGAAAVTGTGTNFDKTGLSLGGNIFEITDPAPANAQPYITGLVSASGITATNVNLTSNWTGRTVATPAAYAISPQIAIPDDVIPAFRMLVDSYVYARINPELAGQRRAMYQSAVNDLACRYERSGDAMKTRGVFGYDPANFAEYGPGIPTELIVRTV